MTDNYEDRLRAMTDEEFEAEKESLNTDATAAELALETARTRVYVEIIGFVAKSIDIAVLKLEASGLRDQSNFVNNFKR
jgi:hypothetical protein